MRIEDARYFHRDGSPAETYTDILEEVSNGLIADDTVNGILVATVYLGINCGTWDDIKIFSTTISSGMFQGEYYYPNETAALEGHKKWVEEVSIPIPEKVQELADFIIQLGSNNPYIIAKNILER